MRFAAFRWSKSFPFFPILWDFKSLVDVEVRNMPKMWFLLVVLTHCSNILACYPGASPWAGCVEGSSSVSPYRVGRCLEPRRPLVCLISWKAFWILLCSTDVVLIQSASRPRIRRREWILQIYWKYGGEDVLKVCSRWAPVSADQNETRRTRCGGLHGPEGLRLRIAYLPGSWECSTFVSSSSPIFTRSYRSCAAFRWLANVPYT